MLPLFPYLAQVTIQKYFEGTYPITFLCPSLLHSRCFGHRGPSLTQLRKGFCQSFGICASKLGHLLSVPEEGKGGHGSDAEFLGQIADAVDIEFGEVNSVFEPFFVGQPTCRGVLVLAYDSSRTEQWRGIYFSNKGEINLQGPHQTADASMATIGFWEMISLNSTTLSKVRCQ